MEPTDDDLPPMAETITEIEPDLILREAKRQYEALVCLRHSQWNVFPRTTDQKVHATRAQQRIDLAQYYRNLFDTATAALDKWDKHRLLTMCFAYKTRARVLQFLDLLDKDTFSWVAPLQEVVDKCAKDSVFDDALTAADVYSSKDEYMMDLDSQDKDVNACDGAHPGSAFPSLANPKSPYGLRSKSKVASTSKGPTKHPAPYFVITTLPLAFPATFFYSFASHAPIDALTVPSILSYPAAMQLANSKPVTNALRRSLPDFEPRRLQPDRRVSYARAHGAEDDESSWAALFEHLLQNRETLTLSSGKEFPVEEGEDGYAEIDLDMWLAAWRAERQNVGNKEEGQETLLRIKLSLAAKVAAQEVVDEVDDGGVALVSSSRKRVGWNENELATVIEFSDSGREKKRRRI